MIPEESSRYLFLTWWFVIIMPCTCRHGKSYTYEVWGPQQWWYGDWATGLMICGSNPTGASEVFLWNIQIGSGAHPAPCSVSIRESSLGWGVVKYQGWQLTSHLYIVPRVRMSGALPPLCMISWHVQGLHLLQWQYIKVMLWDVTQCSYYKCPGGMCCLHTQGRRWRQPALWNFGPCVPDYTVLHPRRL